KGQGFDPPRLQVEVTPDSEEIISGERPPLLLIHDVFSDTDAWAEQIDLPFAAVRRTEFSPFGPPGCTGLIHLFLA
ncbi:MAG TPA: hypothetical protein PLW55_15600, partial [Leptospiraceae bacterium]|nr:hypothetical protein [Leptospiraceae bacterium]